MKARSGTSLLAFAAVLAVSGCSRTYDGSIVPTYEVATDQVAGIPFLTLKATPLDPPNMRGLNIPPPEGVSDENFDTSDAPEGAPARRRSAPARRVAKRAVPVRNAKTLQCRDETPGPRLVHMVCE